MIAEKELLVDHLFPEEYELLNSSQEIYFNNERKCYKYHYTNVDSVKKILRNKNIRLYHYKHLTDSSDGRLLFKHILSEKKYSYVINILKSLYESALQNLYLASFSLYGNRLSQWRGYGDACIGFNFEKMKYSHRFIKDIKPQELDTSGVVFGQCHYIDNTNISEMNKLSDEIVSNFLDMPPNILSDHSEFQRYSLTLGALLFLYKHIGFHEECEYRVFRYLWQADPFIENCKSFVELYFEPESVKRIVLGPSDKQNCIYDEMSIFLQSEGYNNVELYKSTIPFISK